MRALDRPRTSVVIPARNAAKTLAKTLDSLLAQTDPSWEAVIVDDGSTDGTADVIQAYVQRDGRFVGLRGTQKGVSSARNLGLTRVCGRRLFFLDSDDWVDDRFLELMNGALDAAPGAVAAYCNECRVAPAGELSPPRRDPRLARTPFGLFARFCPVTTCSVLVEREVVVRIGGFDESLRTCEDWDLWQRVARTGGCWVHVDVHLSYYRLSGESLTLNVDRLLADAATVIARGFSVDERVPHPDPAHLSGASCAGGGTESLAYALFALWCGAIDCGRGGTGAAAIERLKDLRGRGDFEDSMVEVLLDGVMVGLRAIPSRFAAHWPEFGPGLTVWILELGTAWQDPAMARSILYRFERRVLDLDDLAKPRCLSLTLGLRVDLRDPQPITPPPGIDRLYVRMWDGHAVHAVLVVGILGTVTTRKWLELAAGELGIARVATMAGPSLLRSLTLRRFGRSLLSGWRALRSASWGMGGRRMLSACTRAVLLEAAGDRQPAQSHEAVLARIQALAGQSAKPLTLRPETPVVGGSMRSIRTGGSATRASQRPVFGQQDPRSGGSGGEPIPVLLYHQVTDDRPKGSERFRVSPEMFQAQMNWLHRNGYRTIVSEDLASESTSNRSFIGRPVMISFDDGYQDFADRAWPILRSHDFQAEVFVATDFVGGNAEWHRHLGAPAPLMDATTIGGLASEGVSFGTQLASRRRADGLSTTSLAEELIQSRAALRQWAGRAIDSFAAPFGLKDERLCHLAEECGFRVGFGRRGGAARLTGDPLDLPRIEISGDSTLEDFITRMEACR